MVAGVGGFGEGGGSRNVERRDRFKREIDEKESTQGSITDENAETQGLKTGVRLTHGVENKHGVSEVERMRGEKTRGVRRAEKEWR